MYRHRREHVRFFKEGNANVRETTTYLSIASRNAGIPQGGILALDALKGIQTKERRTSTTTAALGDRPDSVNSPLTSTVNRSTVIPLHSGRYTNEPDESVALVLKEQIPVPLLFSDQAAITRTLNAYEDYLKRFVKGDSFGLQIGESLRPEIIESWRPGMPFRWYDPTNTRLTAMRMDACTWGVTEDECEVVFSGIWIGDSNGSVTLGSNLVGNSVPNLRGGESSPAPEVVTVVVENETSVDSGELTWNVDIHLTAQASVLIYGSDGVTPIPPGDQEVSASFTLTVYVDGFVVEAGDLLAADQDGSIPVEYQGSLLTTAATIINADLFA